MRRLAASHAARPAAAALPGHPAAAARAGTPAPCKRRRRGGEGEGGAPALALYVCSSCRRGRGAPGTAAPARPGPRAWRTASRCRRWAGRAPPHTPALRAGGGAAWRAARAAAACGGAARRQHLGAQVAGPGGPQRGGGRRHAPCWRMVARPPARLPARLPACLLRPCAPTPTCPGLQGVAVHRHPRPLRPAVLLAAGPRQAGVQQRRVAGGLHALRVGRGVGRGPGGAVEGLEPHKVPRHERGPRRLAALADQDAFCCLVAGVGQRAQDGAVAAHLPKGGGGGVGGRRRRVQCGWEGPGCCRRAAVGGCLLHTGRELEAGQGSQQAGGGVPHLAVVQHGCCAQLLHSLHQLAQLMQLLGRLADPEAAQRSSLELDPRPLGGDDLHRWSPFGAVWRWERCWGCVIAGCDPCCDP
jgi:hypothetical protein